jgi:tetratricopeptide (TPR) repeat protein
MGPAFAGPMASPTFVEFAGALVEAMGQRLDAVRPIPEGLVLRTGDGFLYAFLEDPDQVSLDTIRRVLDQGGSEPAHLVVLTPGRLPLAITAEVLQRSGTLVEGARFHELARQLGLDAYLGEEPRPPPAARARLLPSAQQLDAVVGRARTWLEWGVPALALRFYRQAAEMKPEYLPAKVGIGRALLGLGLADDADRAFDEVLASRPDDLDARLGKAAVLGARARPKEEIEMYRALLAEDDARVEVRAHLLAALAELGDWPAARVEVEAMLTATPEDPQLRFLHAVALERTGQKEAAAGERAEARTLGLTHERETALCLHLGLPPPPPTAPVGAASPAAPTVPRARGRPPVRPRTPKARAPGRPRAPKPRARAASRRAAPRKPK